MGAFMRGLRFLNRADPFLEVTVSSRGEQVLAAAGEVHLDRCIKDLKERFAKVNLEVSPPLVSFRETIEGDSFTLLENAKAPYGGSEFIEKTTPNRRFVVKVQVMKRPGALTKLLEETADFLGDVLEGKSGKSSVNVKSLNDDGDSVAAFRKRVIDAIESELEPASSQIDNERVQRYRVLWLQFLHRIWSLGPRQVGPNILLVPDSRARYTITSSLGQRGVLICSSCHVSKKLGFLDVSNLEYLGSMYAVLARRQARVLKEEMQEGSPLFTVQAYVPVAESFGFSDKLRRWTSGAASALLVFSHWEALSEDPFFVPKTDEELEEFGDGSSVLPNMWLKKLSSMQQSRGRGPGKCDCILVL